MAKIKQVPDNWKKIIDEINNSDMISSFDKRTAIDAINKYAVKPINGMKFNFGADRLGEMFEFRETTEGGEFWLKIQLRLRSSVR